MALTASDLAALRSSLKSWEVFEYSAAGIVLLGVMGEYVAEFTGWAADRGIEKKLSKISTLVLIVGIAGEGIGLFRTSQLSGELIASLEEQSNRAFERAVRAEGNAESARATSKGFEARIAEANRASAEANARVKEAEAQVTLANAASKNAVATVATAEARIAEATATAKGAEARGAEATLALAKIKLPRTLDVAQQDRIISKIKRFAGTKFDLWVNPDNEAVAFMNTLESILTRADWKFAAPKGAILYAKKASMVATSGIHLEMEAAKASELRAPLEALGDALIAEGIETAGAISTDATDKNLDAVHVVVGTKPLK